MKILDMIKLDKEFVKRPSSIDEQDEAEVRRIDRNLYHKRYRDKNKAKLNAYQRARAMMPEQQYKKARYRARRRGQVWEISYEDWLKRWTEAPKVRSDASGFMCTAWSLKGANPRKCAQMVRIDPKGPWSYGNTQILYKLQPIPEDGEVQPEYEAVPPAKRRSWFTGIIR